MKKFAFAALLLAAPLVLAACGGTASPLVIEPNWNKNTKLGDDNIQGTYEKLVYTVGTEGGKPVSKEGYSVYYSDGTYTTELTVKQFTLEDGSASLGYVLTADLSVKTEFSYGSAKIQFDETSHSEVEFLPAGSRLKPISSHREVHCHTPTTYPSEQHLSDEYHYSYDIEYHGNATQATVAYHDLLNGTEQTNSYELDGNSTYLDNEEIMFALRGVYSFTTFRTFNPSMERVMNVELRENKTTEAKPVSYLRNGEKFDGTIDTYQYQIGYGSGVGAAATLLYAKKTNDVENEHRNVLLNMKLPILYLFGNLSYSLSEATFNEK